MNRETLLKTANASRIALCEEELLHLQKELQGMLNFANILEPYRNEDSIAGGGALPLAACRTDETVNEVRTSSSYFVIPRALE